MELNQQVSTLQGEMKLLKGEIKAILKEVRTALLSRDNPFTTDAGPPTFRPVGRPEAGGSDDLTEEPDAQPEAAETPLQPSAALAPEAPAPPPIPVPEGPTPPAAALEAPPQQGPTLLRPEEQTPSAEPPPQRWNLLTIASLTAWAEDALAALGAKRFQIVLELACFAELLTPEAKDVLCGIVQLAPAGKDDDRPMNFNECLVVLRQLEAILQGEKVTRLPRKRGARHSRVR